MSGNDPTPFLVLNSRQQYLPCHIKVAGIDLPMAAIAVGQNFYSCFRVMNKSDEVFKFILRLSYRGDRFVVTISAKKYLIWLYEPDAELFHSQAQQLAKRHQALSKLATQTLPQPTLFLVSPQQYQLIDLKIKHLGNPLPGLIYGDRAYSLLEIDRNPDLILTMVGGLVAQQYTTVILMLKTEKEPGFVICIQEPEAESIDSASLSKQFLASWGY